MPHNIYEVVAQRDDDLYLIRKDFRALLKAALRAAQYYNYNTTDIDTINVIYLELARKLAKQIVMMGFLTEQKASIKTFGFDENRIWLRWVGHSEGKRLVDTAEEFNEHIKKLGPHKIEN